MITVSLYVKSAQYIESTDKITPGCKRIYTINDSHPYMVPEFAEIHSFPQKIRIYPQNTGLFGIFSPKTTTLSPEILGLSRFVRSFVHKPGPFIPC